MPNESPKKPKPIIVVMTLLAWVAGIIGYYVGWAVGFIHLWAYLRSQEMLPPPWIRIAVVLIFFALPLVIVWAYTRETNQPIPGPNNGQGPHTGLGDDSYDMRGSFGQRPPL